MRKHVHRAVPCRRCYRVIPWQELRKMYKKRFQRMVRRKKWLEEFCSGAVIFSMAGFIAWLVIFGI